MTITFQRHPGAKYLELGGGSRPFLHPRCQGGEDVCVDVRPCQDAEGRPTVDFIADLNEPLALTTGEFDGVLSVYALEHLSWRKVRSFLKEVCRVLRPGGKAVFVTANTEAQIRWTCRTRR